MEEEANRQKYVIKEAAIMIEAGSHKYIDYLVSINADKSLRINRIINRDNVNIIEIKKRISKQISDKERAKHSDEIITNDGTHSLINQVIKIHQLIQAK